MGITRPHRRPKPRRAPAPKPRRAQAAEKHEDLADSAAQLTSGAAAATGPSRFAGLGPGEAIGALRFLGQQAVREPLTLVRDTPGAARELLRIAIGKSQVGPEKGDKRFADPAWQENPLYHRAMQSYLYYGSRVDPFIDSLGIEGLNRERAPFGAGLGPGGHGADQLLHHQSRGTQAHVRHRRRQCRPRDGQHGRRHAPQPRHAVDGRPQAVQGRRDHRGDARRGHLPDRGFRALSRTPRRPAPSTSAPS